MDFFVVVNPQPSTAGLSPARAMEGGPELALTVNGSNFISGSVVRGRGSARSTTFVSVTELTASIPAADIASPDMAQVTVLNPTPGGGESSLSIFTTFVSDTQLTAAIPAADVATSGTATVTVHTPPPGGRTSNGFLFAVE